MKNFCGIEGVESVFQPKQIRGSNDSKRVRACSRACRWLATTGALAASLVAWGNVAPAFASAEPSTASQNVVARAVQLTKWWAYGKEILLEARFDSEMQSGLSTAQLADVWAELVAQKGSYKGVSGARMETVGGVPVVVVAVAFQNESAGIEWSFSSDGTVTGLHIVLLPAAWSRPWYDKRATYAEEKLTIGSGYLKVPAELDVPVGKGPFPAVVLVPGSGPADMNERVDGGPEEPLRDLAHGLASSGIAVLRYDKPTFANPIAFEGPENVNRVTPQVTDVADAEAATEYLLQAKNINPSEVFVAGHSLGGFVAPMVVKTIPKVAGLIMLAAPTTSPAQLLVNQTRYLDELGGPLIASEQANLTRLSAEVKLADSPKLTVSTPADELPLGLPAQYWLFFQHYSAIRTASSLTEPILVLQGMSDYQVPPSSLSIWEKALAGHANASFDSFQSLDHMFMPVTGKSTPADYMRPNHVASVVVGTIATWVKQQTNS